MNQYQIWYGLDEMPGPKQMLGSVVISLLSTYPGCDKLYFIGLAVINNKQASYVNKHQDAITYRQNRINAS